MVSNDGKVNSEVLRALSVGARVPRHPCSWCPWLYTQEVSKLSVLMLNDKMLLYKGSYRQAAFRGTFSTGDETITHDKL
jgi:hypothetical protein